MQEIVEAQKLLKSLEMEQHLVRTRAGAIATEQKQIEVGLEGIEKRMNLLSIASKILQDVADKVSTENFKKIEFLVNRALATIFTDIQFLFKIESEVKRGNPCYQFVIYKDGIPGTINSLGGGIVVVVAVVLKLIFNVISTRFPVLVLDETLSFLATTYIPNMSAFLKEVSREFGIPILMVTHQDKFAEASDSCYLMQIEGTDSKLEKVDYEKLAN